MAAPRIYTVSVTGSAQTVQVDFIEILAAAGKPVEIISWEISQTTELLDAQDEHLSVLCKRGVGAVTSGSGGSTPTAQPIDDEVTAFGGTVEAMNTTKMVAGSGSIETLESHVFSVREGELKVVYERDERPKIKPGDRWTLELAQTPADSVTFNVFVKLSETG